LKPDDPQDRSKGAMDPARPDAREALIGPLVERARGGDQAAFRELVVLHQTSQRGKGSLYGTTSKAIDYDRWQGSSQQWSEIWSPS
jgi:hypothetical protein